MATFQDIHDDYLKIGRVAVLIRTTNISEYDFNFRNFFDFYTIYSRTDLPVLLRIGAIEDYRDVEIIIKDLGMELLVSEEEHLRCSTIEKWYPLIKRKTPFTIVYEKLPSLEELLRDFTFPVFIKGNRQTSHHSKSKCIIESPEQYELLRRTWENDLILSWQKPVIREYIPLQVIDSDSFPNMVPISMEFRFFYFEGEFMAYGPYWTLGSHYSMPEDELEEVLLLTKWAANQVDAPFVAIDVAMTAEGDWIIIEVNDGQESGFAGVNPIVLWKNIVVASRAYQKKTLFSIIKKCIDRWDPYCLLESGCPEDEFDIESSMVRERICLGSSVEEINNAVSEVFSKQFEPQYFQPHQCIDVSLDIYNQINNNKNRIIED